MVLFCRGGRAPLHFAGWLRRGAGSGGRFAGGFVAEGGRPERAPLHFAGRLRGGGGFVAEGFAGTVLSRRAGAPNGAPTFAGTLRGDAGSCGTVCGEGLSRRAGAPNGRPYIFAFRLAGRRRFWRTICRAACRGGRAPRTGAPTFAGTLRRDAGSGAESLRGYKREKSADAFALRIFLVSEMRFELTQPFGHYPLKVACLPIPPPGHEVCQT